MKIIIDTNVLISATFFGGIPKKVIDLVTTKNVEAYINEEILTEYNVTVAKMITKKKAHINQNLFDHFIDAANMIEAVTVVDICRDPDDNKLSPTQSMRRRF